MLTAFRLPSAVTYTSLHDRLKHAGYVIYPGQGRLAEDIFRIATMGAIENEHLDCVIKEIAAAAEVTP